MERRPAAVVTRDAEESFSLDRRAPQPYAQSCGVLEEMSFELAWALIAKASADLCPYKRFLAMSADTPERSRSSDTQRRHEVELSADHPVLSVPADDQA